MAKLIQKIEPIAHTAADAQKQEMEILLESISQNKDSLMMTIQVVQELYESGILEAMNSMIQSKEKIAKILVGQTVRPEVIAMINNVMNSMGVLTKIESDVTAKLMDSLVGGLNLANASLQEEKSIGLFDIARAIKDPAMNRSIRFLLAFLKGFGTQLRD